MYSTLVSVTLFFTLAIQAVFADFAVSSPEIVACKGHELKVTWQSATPPYNLVIVHADDPCGDALVDAGDFKETFANFKADVLKAGQKVQVSIEDANGEEGWSSVVTVKECPSTSSPASSVAAYASSAAIAGTTLVVGSFPPAPSPSVPVAPIGAAKGDSIGSGAAPRYISVPAVALSAVAGAIALLL